MNNFNLLEPLRDQAAPYSLFKKIGTHFPLKLGLVCLSCILIGRMNSLPTARLGFAAAAPGDLVKAAARKSRADQGSLEMQSCVVSGIQKCWNEVKNENGFCLNTRGRGKPWGPPDRQRGCGRHTLLSFPPSRLKGMALGDAGMRSHVQDFRARRECQDQY